MGIFKRWFRKPDPPPPQPRPSSVVELIYELTSDKARMLRFATMASLLIIAFLAGLGIAVGLVAGIVILALRHVDSVTLRYILSGSAIGSPLITFVTIMLRKYFRNSRGG